VIFRRDLIDHFEWLEGSEYYDEVLDEALVAIVLCAFDHRGDMLQNSCGAWQSADYIVQYFALRKFVSRVRAERLV
jgi:hypothetical protein